MKLLISALSIILLFSLSSCYNYHLIGIDSNDVNVEYYEEAWKNYSVLHDAEKQYALFDMNIMEKGIEARLKTLVLKNNFEKQAYNNKRVHIFYSLKNTPTENERIFIPFDKIVKMDIQDRTSKPYMYQPLSLSETGGLLAGDLSLLENTIAHAKTLVVHSKNDSFLLTKWESVDSEIIGTLVKVNKPIYYDGSKPFKYDPKTETGVLEEVHIFLKDELADVSTGPVTIRFEDIYSIYEVRPYKSNRKLILAGSFVGGAIAVAILVLSGKIEFGGISF